MDDIKIFAKNEKELEILINAVRIHNQDIGVECTMPVMKSCKRQRSDGMELPNPDKIRTLGEMENYKYLSILETGTIKQVEMKEKIQKKISRKN